MKVLDLGSGKKPLAGSYGIDFIGGDFQWNLEKTLPKRFWNKWDIVYSCCLLEHLGNPKKFLEDCKKYVKSNGKIVVITDNASYLLIMQVIY